MKVAGLNYSYRKQNKICHIEEQIKSKRMLNKDIKATIKYILNNKIVFVTTENSTL